MHDSLGSRILELRKALNLSQAAFAKELGISQRHVSQIENNNREASEQLLLHICLRFNTTMFWLAANEGEMFLSPEMIIKELIERLGEKTFYKALLAVAEEQNLAILAPRTGSDTDPELNRVQEILADIWILGDEDLKAWARVQFKRAFPSDVVAEVQKKRKEKGNQSAG